MLPLLTFASGLIVGIAGIRLARSAKPGDGLKAAADTIGTKAREGLESARSGLREAAVTGLSTVEKTSASLRDRLQPTAPPSSAGEAPAAPAEPPKAAVRPAAKSATGKPSAARPARRRAVKPAATPGTSS
ncbi:conserved hypothetical protein [uncultured Pleomorphomonas sp.]|uniref:Uncharacterized protein n=1 Tax=uncultured Pleomorphomonas sp. TaxID=442121 RepID=A0A212LF49_9HYPH|nr:hypothetical protein [uncultured Pleomorphomonas sp.]SCM76193.1 conserved hypothetical protein [uncultured Pleomorphomonas sp.]